MGLLEGQAQQQGALESVGSGHAQATLVFWLRFQALVHYIPLSACSSTYQIGKSSVLLDSNVEESNYR